jgi:transcriptional regulator with PAS, ATPase and Fis domain
VRIVAATNLNMHQAINKGKFREDLYYRLSTIEIQLPPLRERLTDIHLLFRKFASDFAQKYSMPGVRLTDEAVKVLENYGFPGNIRQLKNIAEQISVVEEDRTISPSTLQQYLPSKGTNLPSVIEQKKNNSDFSSEREIMYKVLFDMRNDINDLKKLTLELMQSGDAVKVKEEHKNLIKKIYDDIPNETQEEHQVEVVRLNEKYTESTEYEFAETIDADESLSIQEKEIELIKKSLERNNGKRKLAAKELGISERTLYRKIKQYDL